MRRNYWKRCANLPSRRENIISRPLIFNEHAEDKLQIFKRDRIRNFASSSGDALKVVLAARRVSFGAVSSIQALREVEELMAVMKKLYSAGSERDRVETTAAKSRCSFLVWNKEESRCCDYKSIARCILFSTESRPVTFDSIIR